MRPPDRLVRAKIETGVMLFSRTVLVLRDSLRFFAVPGLLSFTALPFCIAEEQWSALAAFLLLAGACILLYVLSFLIHVRTANHDVCSVTASVCLAWLLVGLACGLPLYFTALWSGAGSETAHAYGSLSNAFFEGISGITSCGLTVSDHPELLPMCLQWWRSLCEWIGGVGIVVFMLLLMNPDDVLYKWYRAEGRTWRLDATMRRTAGRIWIIFSGLTVLSIAGFRLSGAGWWESVNHGLTAVSTGGFVIRSDGFASAARVTQMTAILFMFLGSVSFRLYSNVVFDRIPPWRKATQVRWLAVLLVSGTLVLAVMTQGHSAALDAAFQWTSAMGTCGFSTADLSEWTAPALLLMVLGMVVGGASGSTAGGIKVSRLVWLFKGIIRSVRQLMKRGETPLPYQFDGKEIKPEEGSRIIRQSLLLAGLWVLSLLSGWGLMCVFMPSRSAVHLLFETASALGCVGLSTGVVDASMPGFAKLLFIVLMWAGRLEIMSALILLNRERRGGEQ